MRFRWSWSASAGLARTIPGVGRGMWAPEQENIRLREENARLRRLLAVHSIPIPQLAPENPPPTKSVEPAPPVDKEERARKRIALFRSVFRGEKMSTHGDGRMTTADRDMCRRP